MEKSIAGMSPSEAALFIELVLKEDIGDSGDVTSVATVSAGATLAGVIAARQELTLAGVELAELFFLRLDPSAELERLAEDGMTLSPGQVILKVAGSAQALLAAERSALNTLAHLSGIATSASIYSRAIDGTGCILLDTRKTVPGLRTLGKYAARVGGARNHRMRLDDGVLIKDNHIAVAGSVHAAVSAAKSARLQMPIQVEVDRVDQIEEALAAGADAILCDNMEVGELRRAVALISGRVPIEASGGVLLESIREIALTGVTYVSVGRITQSAPSVDVGLDYLPAST
ncbi:carboxylating nicotinate-nucleotide diphosphorylase [Sphingobium lactosutens]|uniref:carboxylating nicotinate-nucleotide diphosphorylase n=1 Tax=Sphingobium lactosutens TaxID=522773 RepID=UPI0015BB0B60|nr:carboxylating nicotinate-nucleotide diphosphorylase [Sphingobium lactosutens]NWK96207.1 carboxylating nicotinate-nucleotide diphosphorylase [Sphingobium lactosutens]